MKCGTLLLVWLSLSVVPLYAQVTLPAEKRLAGAELREILSQQKKAINKSSAAIYGGTDGRNAKLFGTIVTNDGYILTKASEFLLLENSSLRIGSKKHSQPTVVAYDEKWDILLLKIKATALEPVNIDTDADLSPGTWVISNGGTSRRERRVRLGILSAKPREITDQDTAFLGVTVDTEADVEGLLLKNILEESGAQDADLRKGDIIQKIDGEDVSTFQDLRNALYGKKVGAIIEVELKRAKEALKKNVELRSRSKLLKKKRQLDKNDKLSGRYSKRRDRFPRILQHATLMSVKNVGGPLLNLDGKCIGLTIAHANRSENYAIPAPELKEIITALTKKAQENNNQPIEVELTDIEFIDTESGS